MSKSKVGIVDCSFRRFSGAIETVSQWFMQRMEGSVQSEVGPLRPSELLSLVRRGEIKPQTLLRKNDSAWFPASDVGGLFEAAVRQEVQYFCPACNQRIGPPPRTCPKCLRDIDTGEAKVVRPEQDTSHIALSGDTPQSEPGEEQRSVQNWLKKKVGKKQKK